MTAHVVVKTSCHMIFTASITLAFWLTAERGPVGPDDVLLLRFILFTGAVNSDSIT